MNKTSYKINDIEQILSDADFDYDNKININIALLNIMIHITDSIKKAEKGISKINSSDNLGNDILNYEGLTGTKTRHLYNNLCSIPDLKYLEIGTWYGSSSISALYKNNIHGVFIDNWSQFNGNKNILINALEKFKTNSTYTIIENDCWAVDTEQLGFFDIYLYDGGHSENDHYMALKYYINNMFNDFIFIVDDYNWSEVRDGTFKAIQDLNLEIVFRHEIFISPEDLENMPLHKGKNTWWNGCGIFLLRKTNV